MTALPHSCRCGTRWGGLKTAHCTTCHKTFTVVSAFDKHRRGDTCLDPLDAGLVLTDRKYQCWGFPGREEESSNV